MDKTKKQARYNRLFKQLQELLTTTEDLTARMSTISAVLYHKIDYFFWTGFYILREGELIVGPYQGPLACQVLKKGTGVCWVSINQKKSIIVEDVEKFPGHIACDSRSKSEIVIPIYNKEGSIYGVMDVDSKDLYSFDDTDRYGLEKILELLT